MRATLALMTLPLALALACSSSGEKSAPDGGGHTASGGNAGSTASGGDTSGGATSGGGNSGSGSGGTAVGGDGGASSEVLLPPEDVGFDYQLGGGYEPPQGVGIVARDRTDEPAPGLYNICYVNGFQVQPGEESFWENNHPELILRDGEGNPVIDEAWDERLIDVSTSEKRAGVLSIVGDWIRACKDDGFDAVEIDNLDSFSRSTGLLDEDDAVAMMQAYSAVAHEVGLAIAQKNSSELVPRKQEMSTDFVVAEECNAWDECDVYTAAYGDHVLVIEYEQANFEEGCAAYPELSIVLRDLDLVTPSSLEYVYDGC